jgi:hypothetical protein
VDDTLHFMVRYNRNLKTTYDEEYAIGTTMREEATPIISTSIALALGFSVLSQSSFVPVVYFGMLSALVMLMALLAEFLLTPILLASTRLVTLWDMMSLHLKDQLVKECRLFKGMRVWQIKKLILLSRIHEYKEGDFIMRAGDPANEMYILLDGSVDVCLVKENGERKVIDSAVIGRVFGVFQVGGEDQKRQASALATRDSTVLIISWLTIERIARFYPRITTLFFRNLSNLLGVGIVEQIKGDTAAGKVA